MSESRALLCGLESQGLLPFDELWHQHERFEIPEKCFAKNQGPKSFKKLKVRTVSIRLTDEMRCWDQKIEWSFEGGQINTLYIRQDKKYVGVHSTQGWSAWIERKQGNFRYEFVDLESQSHFRLKGRGRLHPLKGSLEELDSLELLHVNHSGNGPLQATTLSGSKKEGLRLLSYRADSGAWKQTKDLCSQPGLCAKEKPLEVTESSAREFLKIKSASYLGFVQAGRPLAFLKVEASELLPAVAPYR
ncbi:hypothetical protein [Bdellovibrio sp. HCB2-146]|uniref:hypothetical protein n=1 Tax=Bdellovibrio sp. HCB2-146 TaxID=3394362 RepID=UPI0039BD4FDD